MPGRVQARRARAAMPDVLQRRGRGRRPGRRLVDHAPPRSRGRRDCARRFAAPQGGENQGVAVVRGVDSVGREAGVGFFESMTMESSLLSLNQLVWFHFGNQAVTETYDSTP